MSVNKQIIKKCFSSVFCNPGRPRCIRKLFSLYFYYCFAAIYTFATYVNFPNNEGFKSLLIVSEYEYEEKKYIVT